MPDPGSVMAEICAAVACREAARTRRAVAIGHTGAAWTVGSADGAKLAGERVLATLQPGDATNRVLGRVLASLGASAGPDVGSPGPAVADRVAGQLGAFPGMQQAKLFGDDAP